jgi:hypothetical protein
MLIIYACIFNILGSEDDNIVTKYVANFAKNGGEYKFVTVHLYYFTDVYKIPPLVTILSFTPCLS